MTHLHIPDGVLPAWLWLAGWALLLLLLWRVGRQPTTQQIAYQGALGGWMLAAMALPLGPLDYHLSLAGPVGILLGAAGGLQVGFTVSAILAFMGHGGFTTIGLNGLITGASAATAAWVFRRLVARLRPEWAMAWATGAGQLVAGVGWFAVVGLGLRLVPGLSARVPEHAALLPGGTLAAFALPLWLLGSVVEVVVAYGIGRFIARVSPSLLPRPGAAGAALPVPEAGAA